MTPSFADLLQSAVTEPGIISSAYRQFHAYSIGNQLLAWSQCLNRRIQLGYPRWRGLGRQVRRRPERRGSHDTSRSRTADRLLAR